MIAADRYCVIMWQTTKHGIRGFIAGRARLGVEVRVWGQNIKGYERLWGVLKVTETTAVGGGGGMTYGLLQLFAQIILHYIGPQRVQMHAINEIVLFLHV